MLYLAKKPRITSGEPLRTASKYFLILGNLKDK